MQAKAEERFRREGLGPTYPQAYFNGRDAYGRPLRRSKSLGAGSPPRMVRHRSEHLLQFSRLLLIRHCASKLASNPFGSMRGGITSPRSLRSPLRSPRSPPAAYYGTPASPPYTLPVQGTYPQAYQPRGTPGSCRPSDAMLYPYMPNQQQLATPARFASPAPWSTPQPVYPAPTAGSPFSPPPTALSPVGPYPAQRPMTYGSQVGGQPNPGSARFEWENHP